jgi:PAS domain S-box-containing protein
MTVLLSAKPTLAALQSSTNGIYPVYDSILIILLILLSASLLAQQRAVNRFKDSDERHQSILQIALNGIYTTDSSGNLLEVNDTYCAMSGYSREELLLMNICDLEARETADQVLNHHKRLKEVVVDTFQSQQRKKDGDVFDVEICLKFLPGGGGKTLAFVQDISERKQAEKELLSKQYTLEKSQEIALLGAWEYDIDKAKIVISDQAYRIFETPLDTTFTRELFFNKVHPEDAERVRTTMKASIAGGNPFDIEHRLLIDDMIKWIRLIGHPAIGPAGTVNEMVGVTQDITANKQLMDEYRRSAQLAALGTIAASVAHEINNPIQGILNYAGLLREAATDSDRTAVIAGRIESESLRIVKITRELLHYSREDRADFRLVAIEETIEGALTLMHRKIRQQGIQLEVDFQKGLPQLRVQPQYIQQVVINLLDNACDAVNDKEDQQAEKEIQLRVNSCQRTGEPYICLSVRDNGEGMSEQLRSKAEEAFFTTKKMGKGTGLGLTIVNNIAQKHDAMVEIDSVPKQFTEVRLLLPLQTG